MMTNEANDEVMEGEARSPGEIARHWQMQLALAKQEQRDFFTDGRKVVERYKSERTEASRRAATARKFNILFSNTEVLRAAMFGRMAKPDVRRRFADANNQVARETAEVLERALSYSQDTQPSEQALSSAVFDYVLPGRGLVRVEYEPVIAEKPVLDPFGMPMLDEMGQPVTEEFISEQYLCDKYVFWEDFLHEPARNWQGVNWIAFRHTMDGDDLDDQIFESAPQTSQVFGDAKSVPMNWQPQIDHVKKNVPEEFKKAEVWEIWDKRKKQRVWIVEGYDKPLRIDEDPYGLQDFYPTPEPLISYRATDSYVPMPEFHTYRDQADDLDEITARISRLTRALKRRGVYDKAIVELRRLAAAGDNEFIPVEKYAELAQKGGLQASFQQEDITITAAVINDLHKQRDSLIQTIYEVTGISDIVRGSTNPNETLGAQQLKAQFGSNRLRRRQDDVAKWIKGIYRIKAELIAEHFEPEVLQAITGKQITPEMMQILRDEKIRNYSIDIETDSTVFEDANQEKQAVTELLTGVTQFMTGTFPLAAQQPMITPLLVSMLTMAVRRFKAGRELEDVIESIGQQLEQAAAQPPAPPPPDPKMMQIEAEMKRDQQSHEMDMQGKVIDLQVKREKAAMDMDKLAMQQPPMMPMGPIQ